MLDFWEGFQTPLAGLRYMQEHPKLWRYGLVPLALNLIITCCVLIGLFFTIGYLRPEFGDGWLRGFAEVLVMFAEAVMAVAFAFIAWLVLQAVFCSFFYAKLAAQVEIQLGMRREDIRDIPITYQIVDAFYDVSFLVVANLGLLLLNFLPVVGAIAAAVGGYYFLCSTLGLEYFEYPLALRGMRRAEMIAFARKRRAHTLGIGTAAALVTFLPIVNAVLLTTIVTGAVLLHRNVESRA